MGFDPARVVEVYLRDPAGKERVGSGYLVSGRVVLTAGHLVAGPLEGGTDAPEPSRCEVRPFGLSGWLLARLVWWDEPRDVGLLRLDDDYRIPPGSPVPRWGRLSGAEPVACMAVGFPWAQARPDQVRGVATGNHHAGALPASARTGGRMRAAGRNDQGSPDDPARVDHGSHQQVAPSLPGQERQASARAEREPGVAGREQYCEAENQAQQHPPLKPSQPPVGHHVPD